MYRIKCSNGKYVSKTTFGEWIEFTKNGKVWHSKKLVEKNLKWCNDFKSKRKQHLEYNSFTYEIEEI